MLLQAPAPVFALVDIADTGAYVIDTAHVLDAATRDRVEGLLKELEQKTTDQIKVLTVPTTDGEDIFTFSQRHYDHWKLGLKGKGNGALIVLALKDRKVRIHTGYGLEGSLPDSFDGTLSREIAQRYFRKSQYAEGLYEMTLSVVNKVAADEGVKISGLPQAKIMPKVGRDGFFPGCLIALPVFMLFWLFLVLMSRRNRLHRTYWGGDLTRGVFWGSVLNDMLRSGSSGPWGSGGGFGGGGFGGGGGSFGGGGSSGGGGGGASW